MPSTLTTLSQRHAPAVPVDCSSRPSVFLYDATSYAVRRAGWTAAKTSRHLLEVHAPVHKIVLARDEARIFAGEVQHQRNDFVRGAHAADGLRRAQRFRFQVRIPLDVDGARRDAIGGDFVLGEFTRKPAGETDDAEFRHAFGHA